MNSEIESMGKKLEALNYNGFDKKYLVEYYNYLNMIA